MAGQLKRSLGFNSISPYIPNSVRFKFPAGLKLRMFPIEAKFKPHFMQCITSGFVGGFTVRCNNIADTLFRLKNYLSHDFFPS